MDEHSIIFVDDEKQIRAMYLRAFSAPGTRVRAVASAEECLEVMAKDPAPVLFWDLNLPGMDGVALCRRLREGWPGLVIYAVTGYASRFDTEACRQAGFDDYFTKPVPLADLRAAAVKAFSRSGEGAA